MVVVFLGPPGSGKGTQAARLAARAGIPHIATGDMLRSAVKNGTELGRRAGAIMDAGELVPDDIMIGLIRERIASEDCKKGFVLDGFPRTAAQAEALERLLAEKGFGLDAAVNLDVDENRLIERMKGRSLAEGRSDDNPETIRTRLEEYRRKTAPLAAWFDRKGILVNLDGTGSVDDVARAVGGALARLDTASARPRQGAA
jgi:adenylate kinase